MSLLLLTQVSIPERVSAEEFIEWMIAEPQTIVWLPTLHRLAVSETGTVWLILGTIKAPVSGGNWSSLKWSSVSKGYVTICIPTKNNPSFSISSFAIHVNLNRPCLSEVNNTGNLFRVFLS